MEPPKVIEQIPLHNVVTLDDGISEKIQISVKLPGVQSAQDFTVKIQDGHLKLHVPGRYKLDLPLEATVEERPQELKFVKSRSELKASLLVIQKAGPKPEPIIVPSSLNEVEKGPKPVHDSFAVDAAKLIATKRKPRPTSAKAKPSQAPMSNGHPGRSKSSERVPPNPSFEEYERPKRRNRALEKKSLSGFVKSNAKEKEKKTSETQDGDEESSEGFDFIMEQLLPSAYTSQAKKYEEKMTESPPNILTEEVEPANIPPPEDISALSNDSQSIQNPEAYETLQPKTREESTPKHAENDKANFVESDASSRIKISSKPDLEAESKPQVSSEFQPSRPKVGDPAPRLKKSEKHKILEGKTILQPKTSQSSSKAEEDGENKHRRKQESDAPATDTGLQEKGSTKSVVNTINVSAKGPIFLDKERPKLAKKKEKQKAPEKAKETPKPSSVPETMPEKKAENKPIQKDFSERSEVPPKTVPQNQGKSVSNDFSEARQKPSTNPSQAKSEEVKNESSYSRLNLKGKKKSSSKTETSKNVKKSRNTEERPSDHIPAFHPPSVRPHTEAGYDELRSRLKDLEILALKYLPTGYVMRALWLVGLLMILFGVVVFQIILTAPCIPISIAARFNQVQLQKALMGWGLRTQTNRFFLGLITVISAILILYYSCVLLLEIFAIALDLTIGFIAFVFGLIFGSLSLGWSLSAKLLSLTWLFFVTLLWRPSIYLALPATLLMRYGYHITGPIFLAQLCILAPSGPMTIWAMNGGILGLCTLPICLLATLWNPDSGHLHLVCISVLSKVITGILSYFGVSLSQGWISWVVKPSYIILLGAYLYFKDDVAASKQGGGYSDSPVEDLPVGAEGEIARVLLAKDLYEVLGVSKDFDQEDLRKAKRKLSLATHPDKHRNAPGANQAFARVTEAHDVLSIPARRTEYDRELRCKKILEDMEERETTKGSTASHLYFPCPSCGFNHHGVLTERKVHEARWCSECRVYHPAEDGDGWHESSGWPWSEIKMYISVDGKVLDMTEWANCALKGAQRSRIQTNTHDVPYNFSAKQAASTRSRKKARQRNKRR